MTVNDNMLKAGRIPSAFFPIRVVSGLACNKDGQILMGKRKAGKLRPGLWELPGGKIDYGERPEDALCREWLEELGVVMGLSNVGNLLDVAVLHADLTFSLELYPVHLPAACEPQPIDHEELRWVDPTMAVRDLPCSPGYYLQYRSILAWSRA